MQNVFSSRVRSVVTTASAEGGSSLGEGEWGGRGGGGGGGGGGFRGCIRGKWWRRGKTLAGHKTAMEGEAKGKERKSLKLGSGIFGIRFTFEPPCNFWNSMHLQKVPWFPELLSRGANWGEWEAEARLNQGRVEAVDIARNVSYIHFFSPWPFLVPLQTFAWLTQQVFRVHWPKLRRALLQISISRASCGALRICCGTAARHCIGCMGRELIFQEGCLIVVLELVTRCNCVQPKSSAIYQKAYTSLRINPIRLWRSLAFKNCMRTITPPPPPPQKKKIIIVLQLEVIFIDWKFQK